jgi:3-hydroxyisobutyrate dehydrogenase-like beta-hydroxyacid dehydrogenase
MKLGYIGIGLMGKPMTLRLLARTAAELYPNLAIPQPNMLLQ